MSDEEAKGLVFGLSANYDPKLDPYLQAIGRVALSWAEFEFNVNDAIWELANLERKVGTCLTSQLIGPGPRFRCLVALLNLRGTPSEIVKRINVLSADAEAVSRQRNRYLHDPMVWNKQDGSIHRMETTADRTVRHEILPVEIKEIKALYQKIEHLGARFNFLYAYVQAKTPPWSRTMFEQSSGIQRERPQLEPGDSPLESEPPPPASAE
jgi:hypothetical protein